MRSFMRLSSGVKLMSTFGLLLVVVAGLTFLGATRGISHASGILSQSSTQTGSTSATTTSSCGAWSIVPSPNPYKHSGFSDVAAVSANNVWAVGGVVYHWNGVHWKYVSTSRLGGKDLESIAAISANDIWAVGRMNGANPIYNDTLTEHWDGTGWNTIPSPNAPGGNRLQGVTALSSTDVWAVGYTYQNRWSVVKSLIEHWDGTQWSIIPGPNPNYSTLNKVAAVSTNDVWAVGNYSSSSTTGSITQTLIEHWDGTKWSVSTTPNFIAPAQFTDIAAVSANDVWAVGIYGNGTLIEHWNGIQWSLVPSPNPGSRDNSLNGVTAISANNIWAVGLADFANYSRETLTEHWDGTQWSTVSSPNVGQYNVLNSVSSIPGTSGVWAVGEDYNLSPSTSTTLTEFYC